VIETRYGPLVSGFEPAPHDHPVAAGLPAGSVTDDTEQALLLAGVLIDGGGEVDPAELGRRLLAWEDDMRSRGSLDLLGPSTRRAVLALLDGEDPARTGRHGTTNGAAMRIAPVGIASTADDLPALVERVVEASSLTHDTGVALAGAAAVAAAVSAGVAGAGLSDAVDLAVEAATLASRRGHWVAAADVASRIRWVTGLVAGHGPLEVVDLVDRLVGTSLATQESVPAAFAVAAALGDDPWLACRVAASVGGDCDTIAAMTGAVVGAVHGEGAFTPDVVALVTDVNDLRLEQVATALVRLRSLT
jgi:ADP-ribosylglycohydrolase